MKIGPLTEPHIAAGSSAPQKPTQTSAADGSVPSVSPAAQAVANSAPVVVSALARTLETASASSAGDVDLVKVERMRAAIGNGTFTVNPEAIADKLLTNAQEMLSKVRH